MGIFCDLINHLQTHHCRFSTCIFIKLAFSLGFFGFVYDEPYLNSSRFFVLFLLKFPVSLLLASVLSYLNTLFTMCAADNWLVHTVNRVNAAGADWLYLH